MGFEPEDIRKDNSSFDAQFEGGGADIDADGLAAASPVAAPRRSIKNVRARSAQQEHSIPLSGDRTPGSSRRAEVSNPPPVRRPIMRSNSEFGYLFSDAEPVDNHMDDAYSHRLDALAYDGRSKDDGQYNDLLEGDQPSMVRRPENRMSAPEPSADRFSRGSRSEPQSSGRRFSRRNRDASAAQVQPEPAAPAEPPVFSAPPVVQPEPAPFFAPAPAEPPREPDRRFAERPIERFDDRQAAPYDRVRNSIDGDDRYYGRGPRPRRRYDDDDDYAYDYRERRARRYGEYDEPQQPAYPPYGQYPGYPPYPYGYAPYPGYPPYGQYPGYPPYGYPPYGYPIQPGAIPPGAMPPDGVMPDPYGMDIAAPQPSEAAPSVDFPEHDSRSVEEEFSFAPPAVQPEPEPAPEPAPEPEPEPVPQPEPELVPENIPAPPAGGSSRFNRRSRAAADSTPAAQPEAAPQADEPVPAPAVTDSTPAEDSTAGTGRFSRRTRSTARSSSTAYPMDDENDFNPVDISEEPVQEPAPAEAAPTGGSGRFGRRSRSTGGEAAASAPSGNAGGWFDDDAPAESPSFSWDDDDSGSSGGRSSRFSRRSRS